MCKTWAKLYRHDTLCHFMCPEIIPEFYMICRACFKRENGKKWKEKIKQYE